MGNIIRILIFSVPNHSFIMRILNKRNFQYVLAGAGAGAGTVVYIGPLRAHKSRSRAFESLDGDGGGDGSEQTMWPK